MSSSNAVVILERDPGPTLDLAIAAWLDAKHQRTGSSKTRRSYEDAVTRFRAYCQQTARIDLDGDPRAIALCAQAWAASRWSERRIGVPVAANTYNQRLAALSSFYAFAKKRGLLPEHVTENPLDLLDRRPTQAYSGALPLDYETLAARLAAIERTTLAGKRDYALLLVALTTGRRAAELAGLQVGDITWTDGGAVVTWRRCKGARVMVDTLSPAATQALSEWLTAAYSDSETKPWVSVWPALDFYAGRRGPVRGITPQAIEALCARRLGTSRVHALRHTFAHAMEEVGAKVSEIQQRLGHSNLATTGRYLAQLRSASNPYVDRLEALYGVTARKEGA